MLTIPAPVLEAVYRLEAAGFVCHLVGGCVRDLLLGRVPADYDLTTNALPEQTKTVFADCTCVETGIAHGTICVHIDGMPLEITTYRVDGTYTDARHPDSVRFTARLEEDLARRDFTINAMAWHPVQGLTDPFGGEADLRAQVIRCVGDLVCRFTEDALRILRCIRFAAQLGFSIAPDTDAAVHAVRDRLCAVSPERIRVELDKLLLGTYVTTALLAYPDVLAVPIPEILPAVGFLQHSPYHCYDVWTHTAHAVGEAFNDRNVRLTMLLHDLGKPECYRPDATGRGHFKQHAAAGAQHAGEILARLRYDNRTAAQVSTLVAHHADKLLTQPQLRRTLAALGAEQFFALLEVKRADTRSKQAFCLEELPQIDEMEASARKLLAEGACLSLHALAVDGHDLLALGMAGREVGETLAALLDAVVVGTLPNDKAALLAAARKTKRGGNADAASRT